jgi:hypothetical protein
MQNTWHVLQALLQGGYRPRHIAAEFNRVLPPFEALVIPYRAHAWERKGHSCRFGGSMLAFHRLFAAFGYVTLAQDSAGVNVYAVHMSETGGAPPLSYSEVRTPAHKRAHTTLFGALRKEQLASR